MSLISAVESILWLILEQLALHLPENAPYFENAVMCCCSLARFQLSYSTSFEQISSAQVMSSGLKDVAFVLFSYIWQSIYFSF
jgi:hypothetical protein